MELPQKYTPYLEEVSTNSVKTKLFFSFKDRILHRDLMVFYFSLFSFISFAK